MDSNRQSIGAAMTAKHDSITAAMATPRERFIKRMATELDHAYTKHGRNPWSRHEFYGVLKEEVDELWDAIKADKPMDEVLEEVAQIACVCLRYVETGDRDRGDHPELAAVLAECEADAGEVSTYTCVNCLKPKHSMTDKPNLYGQCSECRANSVPVPPLPDAPAADDGPNMAWPAAPMSAPSSDVLDPSPSLTSASDADLRKEAEEAPRIEAAEAEAAASILLRAYGEWKDHKFPLCHESRSDYEKVLMRVGPVLAHYVLATRAVLASAQAARAAAERERCPACNGELSECGEMTEDGPSLDCRACQLGSMVVEERHRAEAAEARAADAERRLGVAREALKNADTMLRAARTRLVASGATMDVYDVTLAETKEALAALGPAPAPTTPKAGEVDRG